MQTVSRRAVIAGLAAVSAIPALADDYPNAPIKVVVPYTAGGTGDVVLRLLANHVERELGRPFVVLNMAGAGGNIGTQNVVRAVPDGYTLLCAATNNFVINQYLFDLSFNPLVDLVPIKKLADIPSVFYTHPDVPAKDLQEFVAYARANPGKLNFGSPGTGTTPHLSIERLKQRLGLHIQHVAYPGAPQALQDLLNKEVQLYAGGISLGQAFLKTGQLRGLAVSWPDRLESAPMIPTMEESGVKDFISSNWFGLAAPKGTPPAIIERLNVAFTAALQEPAVKARYLELGFIANDYSPSQLPDIFAKEAAEWQETIKNMPPARK